MISVKTSTKKQRKHKMEIGNIKKLEIKNTITIMKNTLQRINSRVGEIEGQINNGR